MQLMLNGWQMDMISHRIIRILNCKQVLLILLKDGEMGAVNNWIQWVNSLMRMLL